MHRQITALGHDGTVVAPSLFEFARHDEHAPGFIRGEAAIARGPGSRARGAWWSGTRGG